MPDPRFAVTVKFAPDVGAALRERAEATGNTVTNEMRIAAYRHLATSEAQPVDSAAKQVTA